MKLNSKLSRLTTYVNAWNKNPNQTSYYLKKITQVVQEMNESNSKRVERLKIKRYKKVLKILKGYK